MGLLHRARSTVCQEIYPLQTRAIAQMETGYRIDDPALAITRTQEIPGGSARHDRLEIGDSLGLVNPVGIVKGGKPLAVVIVQETGFTIGAFVSRTTGRSRERERASQRYRAWANYAAQILDHLLDQEIAEGNTAQSFLAIGDRIEDRCSGIIGTDRSPVLLQQLGDGCRDVPGQGHFDEDQRIIDKLRMEEGEAAPVRRSQPAPQFIPPADVMHGFIADDFFQNIGWR